MSDTIDKPASAGFFMGIDMSENSKNLIAQGGSWLAVVIGGISFEMWIALAGLLISGLAFLSNRHHQRLKAEMLRNDEARKQELHALRVARLNSDRRKQIRPVLSERRKESEIEYSD